MTEGNMSSVMFRPFMSIPDPSYFFSCIISFGASLACNAKAFSRSKVASPGIEFGWKFLMLVIFEGSASEGLKESRSLFEIGIEAYPVFSWREYGARKRWRGETRTSSTESSVDFIVISSLKVSFDLDASSFAVEILQDSQKSTSRSEIKFIFALHPGQSIATLFFVKDSSSFLHFMSGHMYL